MQASPNRARHGVPLALGQKMFAVTIWNTALVQLCGRYGVGLLLGQLHLHAYTCLHASSHDVGSDNCTTTCEEATVDVTSLADPRPNQLVLGSLVRFSFAFVRGEVLDTMCGSLTHSCTHLTLKPWRSLKPCEAQTAS